MASPQPTEPPAYSWLHSFWMAATLTGAKVAQRSCCWAMVLQAACSGITGGVLASGPQPAKAEAKAADTSLRCLSRLGSMRLLSACICVFARLPRLGVAANFRAMSKAPLPTKICQSCARPFSWRARWAQTWDQVAYCSAACKGGPSSLSVALEQQLLALAVQRGAKKSACPSEAVLQLCGDKENWPKNAMQEARWAVNRLADQGKIDVLQQGRRVDAPSAKGPIRIRRR